MNDNQSCCCDSPVVEETVDPGYGAMNNLECTCNNGANGQTNRYLPTYQQQQPINEIPRQSQMKQSQIRQSQVRQSQAKQSVQGGNGNLSMGCTCPVKRSLSSSQPDCLKASVVPQQTSFAVKNGSPVPPEYKMSKQAGTASGQQTTLIGQSMQEIKHARPSSQAVKPTPGGDVSTSIASAAAQEIAPCCMPSLLKKPPMSLSESSPAPDSNQEDADNYCTCSDNPESEPNEEEPDICPSCAEFEGDEEPPKVEEIAKSISSTSSNVSTKQTSENGGFWQQVQFQITQQCGGDGGKNSSEESCDPGQSNGQAGAAQDPPNGNNQGTTDQKGNGAKNDAVQQNVEGNGNKGSGKTWQQLTLDIFQSKNNNDGSEGNGDKKKQGTWQQQFRLTIYQEKNDSGNGDRKGVTAYKDDTVETEAPSGEAAADNECKC